VLCWRRGGAEEVNNQHKGQQEGRIVTRIAHLVAACGLAALAGCSAATEEKKPRPEPTELTNPVEFGRADPVQALHWLINAYQPAQSIKLDNPDQHKLELKRWNKKIEKLQGVRVAWPMDAGKLSEGKVRPVRISHPYAETALREDPNLPGSESLFVLEPMTASEPPEGFFEVSGTPEWMQQVQAGVPILLEGRIQSVVVDFPTAHGRSIRRFKVLLDDGAIKQP
jgi:hypothetical protein